MNYLQNFDRNLYLCPYLSILHIVHNTTHLLNNFFWQKTDNFASTEFLGLFSASIRILVFCEKEMYF